MTSELTTATGPSTSAGFSSHRSSHAGAAAVSVVLYLALLDVAIETIRSGAAVRWPVAAGIGAYLALSIVFWRRATWKTKANASFVLLLGVLAGTVWLPGGTTRGVVALGQSTSTLFSLVTAAGVVLAAISMARLRFVPVAVRAAAGALGAYGAAAFVLGAVEGTEYPRLFNGLSAWQRLPPWLQGALLGGLLMLPLGLAAQIVMRIAHRPVRWHFQQVVALVVALVMVLSGVTAPGGAPLTRIVAEVKPVPGREALVARVARLRAAMAPQQLGGAIDLLQQGGPDRLRTTFDVAAMAAELGRHVNRLFAFVRDEVRYEVYEGVLRGERGALMASAANAFDKSLLLSALLRYHGFQTRLVRGRLGRGQAAALVDRMFASASERRAPSARGAAAPPEHARATADALAAVVEARWRRNLALVEGALERSGRSVADAPPVSREMLLDEAADHAWVEYRESDRWVPLDPSFGGAEPGQTFASAGEPIERVPASLSHRIVIRLKVEERRNGRLATRDVLQHEATSADLNGAIVMIGHELARAGSAWSATPVLDIDGRRIKGQSFPAGAAAGGGGLGGALGRFGELLGDASAADRAAELTAVWLDVDFIAPSGPAATERRDLLDRIGPAARQNERAASATLAPLTLLDGVPLALASPLACAFGAGRIAPALILSRMSPFANRLRAAAPILTAGRMPDAAEGRRLSTLLGPALPAMLGAVAGIVHAASDRYRALLRTSDLLFYEATPRLAIVSFDLAPAADGKGVTGALALDLRRNDLRVVSARPSGRDVVWAGIARGVLDGVIEHSLFGDTAPGVQGRSRSAVSAVAVLDRAEMDGAAVVAVTGPDVLNGIQAPEAAKARMAAALAGGTTLVAPVRPVAIDGVERIGWWQVDLTSGETLSVMETGQHQLLEYLQLVASVLISGEMAWFVIILTSLWAMHMAYLYFQL